MIINSNVPKCVQQWAECVIRVKCFKRQLDLAQKKQPSCWSESLCRHSISDEESQKRVQRFTQLINETEEKIKLCLKSTPIHPSKYLLSSEEMLALVGNTLRYEEFDKNNNAEIVYSQVVSPSHNGKCVFFYEDDSDEKTALDLLSIGFGKNNPEA